MLVEKKGMESLMDARTPRDAVVDQVMEATHALNRAVGRDIYFWSFVLDQPLDTKAQSQMILWRLCAPQMVIPPSPGMVFAMLCYQGAADKVLRYIKSLAREHRQENVDQGV